MAIILFSDIALIVQSFSTSTKQANFSQSMIVLRVFRLLRLFRLVNRAKILKVLVNTLMFILPRLMNIAMLVVLIMIIFACMGMNLFGLVKLQPPLNVLVNFQSFEKALILLLRCATGEGWNQMMHVYGDTGRDQRS